MDRLIDEIVKVSVSDAMAAASATAVNTVAVLGVCTKSGVETSVQYDQASIDTEYGVCDLAKVTKAFFLENNPGKVVCIPCSADPTADNIDDLLDAALNAGYDDNGRAIDFYHVVIRLGSEATAQSAKALIDALDEWCETNFRIAHVELQDRTVAEALCVSLATKAPKRVAAYFHSETSAKSLAAAIVASRCADDPARGTWAHKNLKSILADATSKANIKDAEDKGLNIYATVAGVARLYFGTTAGSKKTFIDEVIKKDWLKFRTQEAIFDVLGSANNGDGVDYNDAGIGAIAGAINRIFTLASDNSHRYVLPDSFEVQVPKYADISAEDKAVRNLPDIKVPFSVQGSIHTVKTVELQVVA